MSPELINSYLNEGYENNELTVNNIRVNLKNHGVETKFIDDQLMALNAMTRLSNGIVEDVSEWVNTTGWKGFDVLAFLGY